jgi:hypothetical protein
MAQSYRTSGDVLLGIKLTALVASDLCTNDNNKRLLQNDDNICQQLNFDRIFREVMKLDPQIRLVTICDMDGKILLSHHRPGVVNLLTPEESRKSLEMAVKGWKTRSELAPKIGKGKYVLAEYEKIKRITIPLGDDHLLYVTTEVSADHASIIKGISKIPLIIGP